MEGLQQQVGTREKREGIHKESHQSKGFVNGATALSPYEKEKLSQGTDLNTWQRRPIDHSSKLGQEYI